MPGDKDALRASLRLRRDGMDHATRAERSAALCERVAGDERWQSAVSVAAFVGTPHEPDTRALLLAALHSGKTLWLPRVVDARAGITELVRVVDLDALVPGGFGLLQPSPDAGPVDPAITASMELDVVLVPGLGFDRAGGRLGHGPGHYDRLLAGVAALDRPWRIGLCFSEFLHEHDDAIPVQAHDVPMHLVATERELAVCGPRIEMLHVVELATSARAKCRACGIKIDKGTLRFGERVDNPFGDGLATYWFHLVCGALRRPEAFDAVLQGKPELAFDDRAPLGAFARLGVTHHRLPRLTAAQRDPSGRARCRHCRHTIEKGAWRIALTMWEDGRFGAMGFVHAACALPYFESGDVEDLLARIECASADIDQPGLAEIRATLVLDTDA